MDQVVVLAAARTPFGRFGGAFRDLSPVELGAEAVRAAVAQAGVPGPQIDQVILGNCMGAASLGQVPGRQVALRAGLPEQVNVVDVNTACTAALVAAEFAYHLIRCGQVRTVVAGGFESMSQVPYTLPRARFGYRLGHAQVVDSLTNALTCPITGVHMGIYASRAALARGIDRADQDRWALRSQQRYEAARAAGCFCAEITPIAVPSRQGPVLVTGDEQPRADTSYDKLAALPPAFEREGTVTAGNAPGLNDGAAALVLAAEDVAHNLGMATLARLVAISRVSAPPDAINIAPAQAALAALTAAGLRTSDIDLWEINEAFAAVALTSIQELGVDPERVNVNGGSIAIGHPVGATGARILMTLIYELQRRGGGRGVATICGAGANGSAVVAEVE
ncbi:MAG: thiolase family protein [Anaerolineae bacterium]|nr:thiolase family protein [Anaerolineae bacterium]